MALLEFWLVNWVDVDYINSAIYNPLVGSSYIQLPEELRHSRKSLINIQNKDKFTLDMYT